MLFSRDEIAGDSRSLGGSQLLFVLCRRSTQQEKCRWCGLVFRDTDVIEIAHITPRSEGGQEALSFRAGQQHYHISLSSLIGVGSTCSELTFHTSINRLLRCYKSFRDLQDQSIK